jgi:hypothetical protein
VDARARAPATRARRRSLIPTNDVGRCSSGPSGSEPSTSVKP